MSEIVLDGVTKSFPDGTVAVKDVTLDIADGEFIILVGPSGCGKSTTLNMIAGLEDITSGELRIDGNRANEKAPKDRDMAMVFQSYALYPTMSVRENISFPLRLAKVDKPTIDRKVTETAQLLELTPVLDCKPTALSGGQRQRVAMGRAIVREPKAFLMDEPLSNLDAKLRGQMRNVVSRLQRQLGTTTIYVTHDQTEAMTLGDRVVVMRAGVVQQVAPPQELYDSPKNLFVAGFIGSPTMNFLHAEGMRTALGQLPSSGRLAGLPETVIVGARPEHFTDTPLDNGFEFEATPDIVESMRSHKYAYFTLQGERASTAGLTDLPGGAAQMVARLPGESAATVGQPLKLWLDLDQIHAFDPHDGRILA